MPHFLPHLQTAAGVCACRVCRVAASTKSPLAQKSVCVLLDKATTVQLFLQLLASFFELLQLLQACSNHVL